MLAARMADCETDAQQEQFMLPRSVVRHGDTARPGTGTEGRDSLDARAVPSPETLTEPRDIRKVCHYQDRLRMLDFSCQEAQELPPALHALDGVEAALLLENRFPSFRIPPPWFAALTILDLSANQLAVFPHLAACQKLRCLSLARNQLRAVGPAGGVCQSLVELRLSGNQLTSLRGLHEFPNLARLDLADNRIPGLAPLRPLSAWPKLRALALAGNPVLAVPKLHLLLANLLPRLKACDVPGLVHGACRVTRCKPFVSFCGQHYREEASRHGAALSHADFLAIVGAGLDLEEDPLPTSNRVAASRTRPKPQRGCMHNGRAESLPLRANTCQRPGVAGASQVHAHTRPLQGRANASASSTLRSSLSSHRRLPPDLSSALDDLTYTSLRERLHGLMNYQQSTRCEYREPGETGMSAEDETLRTMPLADMVSACLRGQDSTAATCFFGPQIAAPTEDAPQDESMPAHHAPIFDWEATHDDGPSGGAAGNEATRSLEPASPCTSDHILTPRFLPNFHQYKDTAALRRSPIDNSCFQLSCTDLTMSDSDASCGTAALVLPVNDP